MPVPPHRGYRCQMDRLVFGSLVVDQVHAEANRVHRTPRLVRTSPSEFVQLCVLRRGRGTVSQGDRRAVLTRPGDFVLIDTTAPYVYQFESAVEQVIVQAPRQAVLSRLPALADMTAMTVPGGRGLGALTASLLLALPDHRDDREDPVAAAASASAIDLATQALQDHLGFDVGPRNSSRSVLLRRAQQFIDENLSDCELTPSAVARAVSISERYLFVAFEEIGTSPAVWIRQTRLKRAFELLTDPRQQHRSIQEVGAAVGFTRGTHFSRAFKEQFGMTPRERRMQH
ncbi:helix-turn-helix domain-containing protein [Rhodococcus opacus]|uniref:helix-turn-helix domain-containing protein n=2 Tax=Rhodococcus opacus TaxID=37919 RepID=UPI00217E5AF0|nr:helix-turn-helix domain-containing protein [Rhodococcus opacus]